MTEATLVSRAADAFEAYQGGDRAAFDDLVTMLTPLLWHTVRGTGIDPSRPRTSCRRRG